MQEETTHAWLENSMGKIEIYAEGNIILKSIGQMEIE
jgi:hypothetical protein